MRPDAITPERKMLLSAGYDLTPLETFSLAPGELRMIETGLACAIPEGYYGQLMIRSSLAKKELVVEGGVIDADYRGPVKIMIRNQGAELFVYHKENPVAQLLIIKIVTPEIQEVPELNETERKGSFGSTNKEHSIMLIATGQIEQELKQSDATFLIMAIENKDPELHHQNAKTLLKEFADVFPEKLPAELPPERSIDHRIELENGARPPS